MATSAFAQIPNGGFESWVDQGSYMDPAGWLTYNDIENPSGPVITVEQGSPGAVGAFYALITTRAVPGATAIQGWCSLNGFSFSSRPAELIGQWQYGIQPGDTGVVSIAMTKWNTTFGTRDPIAFGELKVTGDLTGWNPLSVPITYYSTEVPDSAYIQFEASIDFADPVVGSFLKVDDLAFAGMVGMQEQTAALELRIFPSPATDRLNVVADQRIAEVKVLDITGRTVLSRVTDGREVVLEVGGLNTGRYLVQLRMKDGTSMVRPFLKE